MDEGLRVSQGERRSAMLARRAAPPEGMPCAAALPEIFRHVKRLTRRPVLPTIAPAFHCVIGASLVPARGAR